MGGLHAGVFSDQPIRYHECSTAEPQEAQQCSWLGKVWEDAVNGVYAATLLSMATYLGVNNG